MASGNKKASSYDSNSNDKKLDYESIKMSRIIKDTNSNDNYIPLEKGT